MTDTPKLDVPLLADNADGKDAVNVALQYVTVVAAQTVKSATTTAPPGSPADGDAYIVPTGATGAWATHDGEIVFNLAGTWTFITPMDGVQFMAEDTDIRYEYRNALWHALEGMQTLTDGATIDWPVNVGRYAQVTLGGNRTMNAPTGCIVGRYYNLVVIQDGTGSRTLTWDAAYDFTGGTPVALSTGAGAKDLLLFWCVEANKLVHIGKAADYS